MYSTLHAVALGIWHIKN